MVCAVSGGVETVFPGTSTVETDFLTVTWENNGYCKSLRTEVWLKNTLSVTMD
jgi:hypothetical protein